MNLPRSLQAFAGKINPSEDYDTDLLVQALVTSLAIPSCKEWIDVSQHSKIRPRISAQNPSLTKA